jgi:hypothetical protein
VVVGGRRERERGRPTRERGESGEEGRIKARRPGIYIKLDGREGGREGERGG